MSSSVVRSSAFVVAVLLVLAAASPAAPPRTYHDIMLGRMTGNSTAGRAFLAANLAALAPDARILLGALSERASPDTPRYEVLVMLEYGAEADTFEWRGTMPDDDWSAVDTDRRRLTRKYSSEAVKALARQIGYFDSLYGAGESSMPETRLVSIIATDLEDNVQKVVFTR